MARTTSMPRLTAGTRITSGNRFTVRDAKVCLEFGGSHYVQITNPGINIQEFSVSFWSNTKINTANSGFNDWLSLNGVSGGEYVIETNGSTASPDCYLISGFSGAVSINTSPSVRLANKGWKHFFLVGSVSGNYVRLYINTVLVGSSLWNPASQVISSVRFGSRGSVVSRGIKAYMNWLEIFNAPLSQEEIIADFYSQSYNDKLIRRYKINEGSGTTVSDSSGNSGNICTITGATWENNGPFNSRVTS